MFSTGKDGNLDIITRSCLFMDFRHFGINITGYLPGDFRINIALYRIFRTENNNAHTFR